MKTVGVSAIAVLVLSLLVAGSFRLLLPRAPAFTTGEYLVIVGASALLVLAARALWQAIQRKRKHA